LKDRLLFPGETRRQCTVLSWYHLPGSKP
jgi:hypothetical protein